MLRAQGQPATLDPAFTTRPRLADCVAVHPPTDQDGSWILQRGESKYFRVSADFAKLANALDGTSTHSELASSLGAPWTPGAVGTVVDKLATGGLLDDGTKFSRKRKQRLRFAPPLTAQLSLFNPGRALIRLAPVVRAAAGRSGVWTVAVIAAAGLLTLLIQASTLQEAIVTPQSLLTYVYLFAGSLLTTAVHEIAHGATLTTYGGKPNRIGVMLFYLTPAFFCDVSDGWRLPNKADRVRVALSGVVVQFTVAGICALIALALPNSAAQPGLLLFALVTFIAGGFNLLPFIKLDGYIALMSHLDIPHLRNRAMIDGRRGLAKVLFGGYYKKEIPQLKWSGWYGFVCMTFPIYVLSTALALWLSLLTRLGWFGLAMVFAGLLMFAHFLIRGLRRLIKEGRTAGASPIRMAAVTSLLVAGAVAALTLISVPTTANGGYRVDENGQVQFVAADQVDEKMMQNGREVQLYEAGIAGRREIGSATIGSSVGTPGQVPMEALLPVAGVGLSMDAWSYPLTADPAAVAALPAPAGAAVLVGEEEPLWKWLADTYIVPVLVW